MKTIKNFKKFYFLIGIFLFIFIIKSLNISNYKTYARNINIYYLILGLAISPLVIFLKAYRWQKISKVQKINYSMHNSYLIYSASLFLGLATPGRIGEMSKIAYLKKDGYKLSSSSLNSIIDRVFDLLFIILFGGIGLLYTPRILTKETLEFITYALLISAFLGIAFTVYFLKSKPKNYLNIFFKESINDLKLFNFSSILYIALITILSWIIYFISIYFLAASAGINHKISFFYLNFISSANSFIALLPVSILGIGTREAAMIILFSPFKIPKEQIIIFSMLIFLVYLPVAINGLFAWFFLSKKLTNNSQKPHF